MQSKQTEVRVLYFTHAWTVDIVLYRKQGVVVSGFDSLPKEIGRNCGCDGESLCNALTCKHNNSIFKSEINPIFTVLLHHSEFLISIGFCMSQG